MLIWLGGCLLVLCLCFSWLFVNSVVVLCRGGRLCLG